MNNNIKQVIKQVLDNVVERIINADSRYKQLDDALIILRAFGNNYSPLAREMGLSENTEEILYEAIGEDYRADEQFFGIYVVLLESHLHTSRDTWDEEYCWWMEREMERRRSMMN